MKWIDNDTLAATVRNFRMKSGLSQRMVADALGYSRSAYAYKETGRIAFSVLDLQKLAALFQLSPNVFFRPELFLDDASLPKVEKQKQAGLDRLGSLRPEEKELLALLRLYQVVDGDTLLNELRKTVRKKLTSRLNLK